MLIIFYLSGFKYLCMTWSTKVSLWTLWLCYKSRNFRGCKVLGHDTRTQEPFCVALLLCGCLLAGMRTWEVTGVYNAFEFIKLPVLYEPRECQSPVLWWTPYNECNHQENFPHPCLIRSKSSERLETGIDGNWYLVCIYKSEKLENDYAVNQSNLNHLKACKYSQWHSS